MPRPISLSSPGVTRAYSPRAVEAIIRGGTTVAAHGSSRCRSGDQFSTRWIRRTRASRRGSLPSFATSRQSSRNKLFLQRAAQCRQPALICGRVAVGGEILVVRMRVARALPCLMGHQYVSVRPVISRA